MLEKLQTGEKSKTASNMQPSNYARMLTGVCEMDARCRGR